MFQYIIFHLQLAPTFSSITENLSYFFKNISPTFVLLFVIVRWTPYNNENTTLQSGQNDIDMILSGNFSVLMFSLLLYPNL